MREPPVTPSFFLSSTYPRFPPSRPTRGRNSETAMSARIVARKFQAKPPAIQLVRLRASPRPRPAVRRWLKTFLLDSVF